ncbi:FAD-dependent oxidoreductase [Nocardia brevicatena]|uniref:FAD-dependent oxidoreductase n=1 Tax=Nocardia brevicatena TaxID=37327 RepID=UPI0002EEB8F9|nr:FAD-dependent monooxygenase [Nocardia brevicatena]
MRIVVVGAGLAGPLLAQGLSRAGFDVELHERDAADRLDQGYRIHLAPEGDLALRTCLPPELYDRVLATSGKRGSGVRVLDPNLNLVHEMLVPPTPDEETTGRHLTVDRLTFRRILVTGLDVRYGSAFQRYEQWADGRVRVFFADGATTDADLLVAADGTHSPIRAQLLPEAEVIEVGRTEIYGRTPLTDAVRALAPAAALEGFCTVMGDDGRAMPLAAHEFLSGGEDYLMWVVVAPASMFPADLTTADGTELRHIAAELVADWHPDLGALVRLGEPDSVRSTTMRTAKPLPHWETGPVTLMGDAIHTMVPVGNSAAIALKDASVLCRHLTERTGSLLEAVRAYEKEMLEYGFRAVAESLHAAG